MPMILSTDRSLNRYGYEVSSIYYFSRNYEDTKSNFIELIENDPRRKFKMISCHNGEINDNILSEICKEDKVYDENFYDLFEIYNAKYYINKNKLINENDFEYPNCYIVYFSHFHCSNIILAMFNTLEKAKDYIKNSIKDHEVSWYDGMMEICYKGKTVYSLHFLSYVTKAINTIKKAIWRFSYIKRRRMYYLKIGIESHPRNGILVEDDIRIMNKEGIYFEK